MTKQRAEALGRQAEAAAVRWLVDHGWTLLAHRYRSDRGSGAGEVDVIAERDGVVAFVEVKARPSLNAALESVSLGQCQRIAAGASAWLARHPAYAQYDCRFDVVAVLADQSVHHIIDAWRPGF